MVDGANCKCNVYTNKESSYQLAKAKKENGGKVYDSQNNRSCAQGDATFILTSHDSDKFTKTTCYDTKNTAQPKAEPGIVDKAINWIKEKVGL